MSYDYFKTPDPEEEKEVTWGDYGRAFAGGAASVGAGSAGLMRHMFELGQEPEAAKVFRGLQTASRNLGEDIESGMTEEGRARLNAGVTTAKFLEHPFSSAALKVTGMSPQLAATAVASFLAPEGIPALLAAAGTGGWLGAADVADEITKKPDQMSDADLKATSELYRGFRDEGDEEPEARQKLNQIMMGAKPAIAFLLGAGSGAFGPAGNVVRGLRQGGVKAAAEAAGETAAAKGSGFLGHQGVKAAAAEGAATEFGEEGYGGYAAQKSEIEGGFRQKYDQSEMLDRALTGMVLGGGLGAVSGIGGGHGKGKAKADEIKANRAREEGIDLQAEAGEAAEPIQAEVAPAKGRKAAKEGVTVVGPEGVGPAEALALKDAQQPTQPKVNPEDVVPPTPQPVPEPPPQPAPAPPAPQQQQQAAPQPPGAEPPAAPPQPAAPVTPEVTPAAPAASDKPVLTDRMFRDLHDRGVQPDEAVQLNRQQIAEIMNRKPGDGGVPPGASTDVSAKSSSAEPSAVDEAATVRGEVPSNITPEPSAPAEVATAPGSTGSIPAVEGEAKKPHKKGKAWEASNAQRAEHAKALYDAFRDPYETIPAEGTVKRDVREAMAKRIDAVLAKAAEHGLVPRENLQDNVRIEKAGQTAEQKHQRALSIPERASGETSPHVIYLRELIGVRNALRGQKFGPKSEERARVADFIAEHNIGEKGLQLLAERRLVEGRNKKAVRGSGIAAPATKVTKGSEDLPASPVRNVTEQLRAQYEKPGVGPKGAEVLAKAKPETEAKLTTPEPSAAEQVATAPAHEEITEGKGKAKAKEIKAKAEPKPAPVATEQQGEKPAEKTEGFPPKAEAVTTPPTPVTSEVIKPAAKKQPIDMETKTILRGLKWTEGDIAKMTTEEATHKADEGISKEAVTEEDIPEGLTAKQAKAFRALDPEGQQKVRAALEARTADVSDKQASKRQGKGFDDELIRRMEEDLGQSGIATPAEIKDMDVEALIRALNVRKEVKLHKDERDIWDTSIHKARDLYGHEDDALSAPMKTSDVLRNLNLEHLDEHPKYIQDFVRKRLTEVLDRVPIYLADNALIADVMGRAHNKTPGGYFSRDGKGRNTPGHIVVNRDALNYPGEFERIVIHEALHAALAHRLDSDANFRTKVEILRTVLERDTKGHPEFAHIAYALTDEHEFISEALSNPQLQKIMFEMKLDPEIAEALGISQKKINTLWGAFVEKVRKTLGIPEGTYNLLHETLKVVAPEIGAEHGKAVREGYLQDFRGERKHAARLDIDKLRDAAVGKAVATSTNWRGKLALAKDKFSMFDQLSARAAKFFGAPGASNLANKLFEAKAFMERAKDAVLEKYKGLEVAARIAIAERTHPEAMRLAKAVVFDASLHDVNVEGSNDHLGKDRMMGIQAKNEIARLQKEWSNPAINPVRGLIRDAVKSFRDIHNAVSRATIDNILAEANIHDPALAERIHTSGLTEEDRKTWAGTKLLSALDQVQGLKRREGWYIPFRRYGEFSSTAYHELSTPANGLKINDNTIQFVDPTGKDSDARARVLARAYLRQQSHTPQGNKLTPVQVRQVWVDKTNPTQIVPAEDTNAIPAYRVAMQTQHTEMHETRAEALESEKDLTAAGLVKAHSHAREEAYSNDRNIQGAMGTVLRSLEKQQRYIDADSAQKQAMREMFHDLTLGLSGTTSIKNSMRQRRNVAGMSRDLGRITGDYARMTANHLAMLEHRPKIDAIFKEMRDYMEAHKYESADTTIRRDELYKEFQNRIYGEAAKLADQHKGGVTTRLLQLTRLARLAGPSFHIINAHEPWTTSLPVIGGNHGFVAAARGLKDAYNFIGGRAATMAGLKDTARAYTDDTGFTNYVKLFKDTIGKSNIAGPDKIKRMQDMIDYMDKRNLYANSALFEVGKFANPEAGVAGRIMDRADLMANQVGSAIESINRTVTGLTAYNLEYKKNGGNHEAAMHYAYTTARQTMGDYSGWNAPPVFNTALGRPALQFRKFGQKTYYLLGNIMGGALKGDPEAMKQFAGLMVTHGLVAGVLGLPTEPIKLALIAANMLGVTGFTPDDYEYAVRQLAARLAGQKGGEIISKGLYRGIGIEVSGRLGISEPFTFGAPKSEKRADITNWLATTMAGAPAGYLLDQIEGAQKLMKGDVPGAIEKMSPLRTVGDIVKAGVGLAGDKKNATGKTTQEQFNAWEATVRALGFTPSSASEMGALRGTQARESRRLSANRSEIVNAWVDASGSEKVAAQRLVQRFNEGRPADEQITQKDLSNAAKKRERDKKVTEHGITTSKRTRALDAQLKSVFNP